MENNIGYLFFSQSPRLSFEDADDGKDIPYQFDGKHDDDYD